MATTVKDEAHKLIESLPDDATWEDFKYAMYVRAEIEAGLRSRDEAPMISNNEIRAKYGLKPLP
ncbi:MAG: hypothetical protein FIB00_00765 [Chloroflexi bacterium]|jgi:hypothetical protein|nr:hypothetical protein [Chloroflexota bacterium]PWB45111.1 MAG: hypothetical protein C3F10_07880 [Dehalococcoidia bacterium]